MLTAMVALQARQIGDPFAFTLGLKASLEARFGDRLAPMAAVDRAEALQMRFVPSVVELSPSFFVALANVADAKHRQEAA